MLARRLLWSFGRTWLGLVFLLVFRLRVFGASNVPDDGGVLIVSNHQSYLDPMLLGVGTGRMLSFMARRSLFRRRWFGRLLSAFNAFPVTRGGRDLAAVREAIRRLRSGWCVVVFPEGTRTRDGSMGRIMPGVLSIARRAGVSVVPAVVAGAFEAWPRGRRPRPRLIRVAYGPRITPSEYGRLDRDTFAARLSADMVRLQAELRQRMGRDNRESLGR